MTGKRSMTYYFSLLLLFFIVLSCTKNPAGTEQTEARWQLIPELGEQRVTELYVNSEGNRLCFTTEYYYGIIRKGYLAPEILVPLQTDTIDCISYVPFINDEYYTYCNADGDLLHIGNSRTGEYIDTIGIDEIVAEADLPAKFSRSSHMYYPNHMVYHDDLYMLSIRHNTRSSDDWLYFGDFNFSGTTASFVTAKKVASYAEPGTTTIDVRTNYYYGGYFWQYRNDSFHLNVCAVNEDDLSPVYTNFIPMIRSVSEHDDYLLGFFDLPVKRSYDGGFTWEDWIVLNAPWNHEIISDIDVFFFSQNLGSIDFNTLEISNYDNGELSDHCISDLAEFDDKVFAATKDGLFYCDLEEFFSLEPEDNRNEDLNLEFILQY